ncbi:MAG: toll/interleukin-1 receptor domain-containing protein, partial [Nitrosospira sp.]
MKTVFVSYAHVEAPWCRTVLEYLETPLRDLVNIWVDYSLVEGQEVVPELKRKVQTADGFLVIVSEKYLGSDFIQQYEWPWIKQELESGKKLFWVPQDVNPQQNASSEILKYLSAHQAAYGKLESLKQLQAKDSRSNTTLSYALLSLLERIRNWAGQQDKPVYQTKQATQFNGEHLEKIRCDYLNAIVNSYSYIRTRNLNDRNDKNALHRLPLDQIYITLEADPTSIQERRQTRALFEEMADATIDPSDTTVTFQDKLAEIIRDREAHTPDRPEAVKLTSGSELEVVFRRERVLVILGDPGSGKSVLCRWIALQMALSMLGENSSYKVDMGPPRFPILLRVAKFAEFLKKKYGSYGEWRFGDQGGNDNDLYQFLGEHPEEDLLKHYLDKRFGESNAASQRCNNAFHEISAVCQSAIEAQKAVLLVDGLDEVIDAKWRGEICHAIENFITKKIMPHPDNRPDQISLSAAPGEVGGNQAVLTSRITGY